MCRSLGPTPALCIKFAQAPWHNRDNGKGKGAQGKCKDIGDGKKAAFEGTLDTCLSNDELEAKKVARREARKGKGNDAKLGNDNETMNNQKQ